MLLGFRQRSRVNRYHKRGLMVKLLKQYIKKRLINLIDHRIGEHQNVFSAAASELPNSEDYSDDLFKLLYNSSHRIDGSLDLAASTTIEAFSHQ